MESPSRGGRYPASSRVAHKLGSDIAIISLPHRPRQRANTAGRDDIFAVKQHLLDTSSLSGTTAPSSPTLADSPSTTNGSLLPTKHHRLFVSKSSQHLRRDAIDGHRAATPQITAKTIDGDDSPSIDLSFRKHHRGIGSIDSMLSSTTCVNTQSECSRPASRVSRANRYDIDVIPSHLILADAAAKCAYDEDDDLVLLDSITPTHSTHFLPTSTPTFTPGPIPIHIDHPGEDGEQEEVKVVNEISSWVLRSLWGKEVDECVAPLLVSDCTHRYLQELWTAAEEGVLRCAASPEQSSSPHGSLGSGNQGTPNYSGNGNGKGKRKAGGGSDDEGYGDQEGGRRDEEGSSSTGAQRPNGRVGANCNLSCPYRKRNPLRFNVREYYVCATHSFADMSQLKKHIRAHHPPVQRNAGPFSCPRCFQGYPTKNDLDDHLRQPDVCHITFDQGGADPEDGITQKIIMSLEARTLKLKIDNWTSLWKLLFPADKTVPDPTFIPVMEVFDFVAESKKFLVKLRDLLELQYRYVLDGADQKADVDRKIHQGLDRSTQSIYNWVETVIQDWEQRFTGAASLFSQSEITVLDNNPGNQPQQPVAEDTWTGTSQLLPPSPALTPTVAPGVEPSTNATVSRDDSPESVHQASLTGGSVGRRTNPPTKKVRRSDAAVKTQIPVPIQKARTPQPQNRTPSSSLRRPSGVPVLSSHAVATLPSNPQIHNPRPSYPQQWVDYPQVSAPFAQPYTGMTSSPGLPPQHHPTAPAQYPATIPQSPFLPSEPPTPAEHHQLQSQQQQPQQHMDSVQHEPVTTGATSDPRFSTIRASRFLGATPRSSLTSVWIRDNANRDSAQTLVEAHPPGPCQNMYCPSCSKTLPDGVGHPGMPHTPIGHQPGMYDGGMVGPGGFPMHVVGEEHGGFPGQGGEWAYGVEGGGGMPGMFGHGGMQEGF